MGARGGVSQGSIAVEGPCDTQRQGWGAPHGSGVEAIVAKVYKGPRWLDGKECIVPDYSETSILAERIRDEIRLIGPDFYLGSCTGTNNARLIFVCSFEDMPRNPKAPGLRSTICGNDAGSHAADSAPPSGV